MTVRLIVLAPMPPDAAAAAIQTLADAESIWPGFVYAEYTREFDAPVAGSTGPVFDARSTRRVEDFEGLPQGPMFQGEAG